MTDPMTDPMAARTNDGTNDGANDGTSDMTIGTMVDCETASGRIDPGRRSLLVRGAALGAALGAVHLAGLAPARAAVPGRDPRLVTIVLRGALDGLAAVTPVADPRLRELRPLLYEGRGTMLPLGPDFALNPALPGLHAMMARGEARAVHAVATPYRGRSHFDGQDVLEAGAPTRLATGWLNRAASTMGRRVALGRRVDGPAGLAIDHAVPLVLRGPAPVTTWAPGGGRNADADLVVRVSGLLDNHDPALADAMRRGADLDAMLAGAEGPREHPFALKARRAGEVLARDDGPRVAALSFEGWDTHFAEGALGGRLSSLLGQLDDALAALKAGLGPAWRETVVVVVTEFGRTARINGSLGTDHGTGTLALLAGGALAPGPAVTGEWPGLARLHEDRDLMPTTDLRALLKGVMGEHLGVSRRALEGSVFPDSAGVLPMAGLIG